MSRAAAVPAPGEGRPVEPALREASRYEVGPLLGEGSMGRVFKARDVDLDRVVALKFLRGDAPVQEKRFFAEARAQARVVHPNVCRVYELGRLPQGPFISMQFVDGGTCQALARELSLAERVAIVRAVADAVQAAHDTGLLHRDLKPANVLVERRGGELHPFVTDFGLARDLVVPGSTAGGTILGSPLYMAPEQAEGDLSALDARTDVYGLGGILYELLVGRPPFLSATSLQALYRTLHEEPVAPRKLDPLIPRELERIALQCLEKRPHRRYAAAREVAEDLRRFLAGERVLARRPGPLVRAARTLSRHRFPAALAATALAAGAVLAATRLATARRERQVATLSQRLGERLREVESSLHLSALLPPHDVRPERKAALATLATIRSEMAAAGPLLEVPGLLALGHGHLALRQFAQAEEAFTLALARAGLSPQDHAALGLAMGARYAEQLGFAGRMGGADRGRARAQELEQARTAALQHLREAGSSSLYVEGLIALYERRYDDALLKARLAFVEAPFAYEAKKLEGDVFVARAVERLRADQRQQAMADFDLAGAAFAEAGRIGRSDPGVREAECGRQRQLVRAALWTEADPRPTATAAVAACRDALAIDPDSVAALNDLSWVAWSAANWMTRMGLDSRDALHEALTSAEAAARLDPRGLEAQRNLGAAWHEDGLFEEAHGGDPRPFFLRHLDAAQKLIALEPTYWLAWNNAGGALLGIALYETVRGLDPTRKLQEATASLEQAQSLNPGGGQPLTNLAWAQRIRARWQLQQGADPGEALAALRRLDAEARGLDANVAPHVAWAACDAALLEAVQRARGQADAAGAFDSAVQECRLQERAGIRLEVRLLETWGRTLQAAALGAGGLDPRAAIAEARSLLRAARGRGVPLERLYLQSRLDELSARDAQARGRDPSARLRDAERSARSLVAQAPGWPLGHVALARVERTRLELHGRQEALADARSGLESASRALELRPGWSEALALKAGFEQALARASRGAGREALLDQAARDLAAARVANPLFERTFLE